MKNLLALETSSPVLSIALQKGQTGKILEKTVQGFSAHAENIIPVMDGLLKRAGLSIHKIDAFLIGRGPGSFTGLRVGFATLKGFLAVQSKPCFGGLSLDLIAENAKLPESSCLGVCLDAFRQKTYARFYRRSQSKWEPASKPESFPVSEILDRLPSGEISITGNAIERYGEEFLKKGEKIRLLPKKMWYPTASSLISLFRAGNKKIEALKSPANFIPLYFRPIEARSMAEIAKEKKELHAHAC